MNPTAIYSKTGKGVQEASGRTSHLSRADRAVLAAVDGKSTVAELSQKFEKIAEAKFYALIEKMDRDGFVREASPGAQAPPPRAAAGRTGSRTVIPTPPPPPKKEEEEEGGELDFTSFIPTAPKAAAGAAANAASTSQKPAAGESTSQRLDLAAKAHADAERKAQQDAFDFKAREEAAAKAKAEAAARAKAEAEAKAKAEAAAREKAEAEARAKAAAEAREKAEAEAKAKAEAEAKAREETEAKSKALRDAAVRAASEARQKAEAEAKAKAEAEARARKEAEERARIEQEMNAKLEAERKAREEAEQKVKDEAERAAKQAEERARREVEEKARQESEALRQQLEAERKAREEAERKAREEEERRRKEADEAKRKEEEERRRKQAEEEARRETEEAIRRQTAEATRRKEAEEAKRRAEEEARRKAEEAKAAPAASALSDDLLADLDSFAKRDDEAQQAHKAAERRAREEAERTAREAEARKRQEEEAARQRAEQARRRQEAEARAREEAERAREDQERQAAEQRKREAEQAALAAQRVAEENDIEISDEDLDMDEVLVEERMLSKSARKAEKKKREREHVETESVPPAEKKGKKLFAFKKKEKKPKPAKAEPLAPKEVQAERIRRRKLGKPLAIGALLLIVAGVGVLHVMPMPTGDYESAASASLGVPVKITSAGMSLIGGAQVTLEGITIGSGEQAIRAARARAFPSIGALLSGDKTFSRIELERAVVPQSTIAQGLLGGLKGGALRTESIVLQNTRFEGPFSLPALNVTLTIAGDGRVARAGISGGDGIEATLTPKGKEIVVEAKADALNLPFLAGVTLADVGLKGTATREGLRLSGWDARLFDGVISGNGEMRWGAQWSFSGDLVGRGVNAAVLAPALLSEGKADANGRFSMSGPDAAALAKNAQIEGRFTLNKGVLGSFDLSRAIQTKGKQPQGRTLFSEMSGEGVYQAGAVSLRKLNMGAGKMSAAGTLDIAPSGEINGRLVADIETGPRTIHESFGLTGTVTEPRLNYLTK